MNDLHLTVLAVRQEIHLRGNGVAINTLVMSLPSGEVVEAIITEETLTRLVGSAAATIEKTEDAGGAVTSPQVEAYDARKTYVGPPLSAEKQERVQQWLDANRRGAEAQVEETFERDENSVFDESGVEQG